MLDTVINGTRTSRSILGNLNIPEDWALARAQLVGEGWPIDLGQLNNAGLSQRGTDLNKASLLTDALCSALGLPTTATPTEAMEKLRQLAVKATNSANSKVQKQSGSYIGDGTTSKSLSFSFAPSLVFVGSNVNGAGLFLVAVRGAIVFNYKHISWNAISLVLDWGNTSLSWRGATNFNTDYNALNSAGSEYYWVALG